ncbi:MAG: RNA polymerase sigma factor [Deltaproteobacteria bacterium]|nr:RNA polymerase sigma factor [Deltaproteobacteria bacterium]
MTDSRGFCHKGITKPALQAGPTRGAGSQGPASAPGAQGGVCFEEVFRTHFDFVWSALRRLGVPPSSVDDAVQDAFLVVHRRLADFEGRSTLRTWLYGIVLRVARDHRRRSQRADLGTLPPDVKDDRPGPHDTASRSEALRLLERLLRTLDEDKREVLILADMEGLTAPEIADLVGANLNTVYSRLRAARQLFNEAVARQDSERR